MGASSAGGPFKRATYYIMSIFNQLWQFLMILMIFLMRFECVIHFHPLIFCLVYNISAFQAIYLHIFPFYHVEFVFCNF